MNRSTKLKRWSAIDMSKKNETCFPTFVLAHVLFENIGCWKKDNEDSLPWKESWKCTQQLKFWTDICLYYYLDLMYQNSMLCLDFHWTRCTRYYTQIGYEFLHPDSFICCFQSSYVLRFSHRSCHDALLGIAPTDRSTVGVKTGGSRVGGPELCV